MTFHIFSTSRTVRIQEGVEDSYYLRRNQSFYIHVVNDVAARNEVRSLFSSDFYNKVSNAVALTTINSAKESFSIWTKSPCHSMATKLTNVWTKSSGFRNVILTMDHCSGPCTNMPSELDFISIIF